MAVAPIIPIANANNTNACTNIRPLRVSAENVPAPQ